MISEHFVDCSTCTDCPLHESAESPGIPTRPYVTKGFTRALLVVGSAPDAAGDKQGKSWVGYAGLLLEKLIQATGLADHVDVYFSNACRCRPPQGGNVSPGQVKKCRPWLHEDVVRLNKLYDSVLILACGAPAARSVGGFKSLREALKNQGDAGMFFTFHPGNLHPSRKPALVKAVEAHFNLLKRYIQGRFVPNALDITPEVGAPVPSFSLHITSCDIETYGILKGQEQTVFQPIKSLLVDGVPYDKQVATVSFAYRDESGKLRTPLYVWENREHRWLIRQWFKKLSREGTVVVGQNIKFDLKYLRAVDKELRYWISPLRLKIDDTMLMSFLLYEQQPEKDLKSQALLLGVSNYAEKKDIIGAMKGPWDSKGHEYNCEDSGVTLVLHEEYSERIANRYGADSPKLSQECADLRNAIIWDVLDLEENGAALNTSILTNLQGKLEKSNHGLREYLEDWGIIPQGKGSDKSLREFIGKGLKEAGLYADPRVEWTKKTKKMCLTQANVELALTALPEGDTRASFETLKQLRSQATTISTYTKPLLTQPRKGIVEYADKAERVGLVYSAWYPIPSYHSKSGKNEKTGGQIQGRFSAQRPCLPTFPPDVRKSLTTRHKAGVLGVWDLSQIELRMAALFSGDPLLVGAYEKGLDLHSETARLLFPTMDPTTIAGSDERQLTKKLNFLVIYKGGGFKFQTVARAELGVELEIDFCNEIVRKWYADHRVFEGWQNGLIETVRQQGYLELPTGWSRTFAKGCGTDVYINEICNFPLQCPAAQLTQSAQFSILRGLKKKLMQTKIVCNTYDALYADMPWGEYDDVCELMDRYLTRPPLLKVLEDYAGRSIPMKYEHKVLDRRPKL